MMSSIADEIKSSISESLKIRMEKVTESARFSEDLGVDSLGVIELMVDLEQKHGVKIPDEDAKKLITVGDTIEYIENKTKSK